MDGLCQLVNRDSTRKISEMLLQDKDALVRQQAASSLSYMADQTAAPALVKALKDDALAVRYAAANTLGAMHYAPAEDALIDMLADASMRRVAISAQTSRSTASTTAETTARRYLAGQTMW